ncbi:insulinase family protein [Deinococcus detaillensis]|uniref:Insulinase family protein n=1 Tax=Deinococcus detaillensis TaxID=2592048 RepID=A0A553V1W9_9DEIO|nr:insulinase family protein [Deinococcus detaillensis]TSA86446.1 insulinase family protein [Deinococcus detaillensis]
MTISEQGRLETLPKVGDQLGRYTVERVESLPDTASTYIQLRHELGSRHIHIARADENAGFAVTFPTVPKDSTGVPHILEHIALMGSKKYPVSDPFFAMIPRSLNTFMNAMTAADWTTYLFSTRNPSDFSNLLGIYLDAAFFPRMTRFSFLRDGHRFENADPADPKSELKMQGVVYNEMKGAMASAGAVLYKALGKALYPDLTYANNSGGEPANIPDLTYEDLKAFHAAHYHPSNAFFYSYGQMPLAELLTTIERDVMSQFEPNVLDVRIPDQANFDVPRRSEVHYPSSDTERGAQVVVAWKVTPTYQAYDNLKWSVLSEVLLGNPAAPLYKPLIDSGLGSALADGSGYSDNFREAAFGAGLKGLSAENAGKVEALVLDTLAQIEREGLDDELIDSALHQFEIAQREVSNAGTPYALKMLFAVVNPWLYGGDPVASLNLAAELEKLSAERKAGRVFEPMIRQWLLENSHRVTLTLTPDPAMQDQQAEAEKAMVARLSADLTDEDRAAIVKDALMLQNAPADDHSLLPTLGLPDVTLSVPRPDYQMEQQGHAEVYRSAQPTGGLIYLDVQVPLPELSQDQLELLPFYAFAVTRNGAANLSEVELTRRIEAVTGGIGAAAGKGNGPDQISEIRTSLTFSGKALSRNKDALVELLRDVIAAPKFSAERLAQLVNQRVSGMRSSIIGNGSAYASTLAGAQVSPLEALGELQGGVTAFKRYQAWQAAGDWSELQSRLEELSKVVTTASARLVLSASENDLALDLSPLAELFGGAVRQTLTPALAPHVPQARTMDTPVAYNAVSFATVPYVHADSPALLVLSKLLRTEYLLKELREKGGAYGGGASFDPRTGAFDLTSFRDPHIGRTFEVFGKLDEFLSSDDLGERQLTEAILSASRQLDPLLSADSVARSRIFSDLAGFSADRQEDYKARMMKVTLEDLRRVQQSYLLPERAGYATFSGRDPNAETAEQHLKFEVESI